MNWPLISLFGLGFLLTCAGGYAILDTCNEEKRKYAKLVYLGIELAMAVSGIFFMGLALSKVTQL